MMRRVKFITRKMMREQPDTLFVFGDNMIEAGFGGQARECRGEPNAVGIPTKLLPSMGNEAFFRDADYERAKPKIDAAFMKLVTHVANDGDVVWPEDGIGTGLAQLEIRAPKIWALIEDYSIALDNITIEFLS